MTFAVGKIRRAERPFSAGPRRGYTAIELLIVLSIIVILSSMAIPAILPALRKGRVNDVANAILLTAQQARSLAMQRTPPTDNKHYGVIIVDDPSVKNNAVVALVYGLPGTAGTYGDLTSNYGCILTKNSKPVTLNEIPPSVSIWVGDSELRSQTPKTISWYYEYRSGLPIAVSGGAFTTTAVNVGSPALSLNYVWGRLQSPALTVTTVAPGTASNPGLSVRSVDGRVKRAVAVYVSGMAFTGEF